MVWLIVTSEAAVLGLTSWALAGILAWPVSKGVGNFIVQSMFKASPEFSFELRGFAIWLAAALVLSTLASFIPAWHASLGSLREALTFE
ncbi:MAG: hypothetical protein ABI779_25440 [Acidobacteriota bacterium]